MRDDASHPIPEYSGMGSRQSKDKQGITTCTAQ